MTDLSTYVMLDDVNLTLLDRHASSAHALAGYVNGDFANFSELSGTYAKSGKFLLSIDVANRPAAGAQCLDIENGDATIGDAPSWFKATQAAGQKARDFRWFPKLYTSESNLEALVAKMAKAKVARSAYMLWSAHYTGHAHICGPRSCGSEVQADATQWTDTAFGVNLDESECYGYFFSGPPGVPVPVAHKAPAALEPVLRSGSKGTAVKLLQGLLNARPIHPGLKVDGDFGAATLRAVETVQRNNKLAVDGVTGPKTWALLGNYS